MMQPVLRICPKIIIFLIVWQTYLLQSGLENVMNLTQNYSFYCEELDVQTNE
jgi:hypothetical protein